MEKYLCAKELAAGLEISVRTLTRWSKMVKVPPTIAGHACHRWSLADKDRLISRVNKAKAMKAKKVKL